MPFQAFNNWSDLYTYLVETIGPNGAEQITGQKQQDALATVAASVITILASLPGETVNDFDPWDAGTTYEGGAELVVRHANKLWLFISADDSVGTEPGTNGLVWQEISAVHLAHFRNGDTMLARDTPHQVTAEELRSMLDAPVFWGTPILGVWSDDYGAGVGSVVIVDESATGVFDGHDGKIATCVSFGVWSFRSPYPGEVRVALDAPMFYCWIDGEWHAMSIQEPLVPSLEQVLSSHLPVTGAHRILFQMAPSYASQLIAHNAAGTVTLNPMSAAGWQVIVSADVEFSFNSPGGLSDTPMRLKLIGVGGPHAVTWATDKWRKPEGVTLPSSIEDGEMYYMTVYDESGTGGRGTIASIVKIEDND